MSMPVSCAAAGFDSGRCTCSEPSTTEGAGVDPGCRGGGLGLEREDAAATHKSIVRVRFLLQYTGPSNRAGSGCSISLIDIVTYLFTGSSMCYLLHDASRSLTTNTTSAQHISCLAAVQE